MTFAIPWAGATARLQIRILFITAARRQTETFARMLKGSPGVATVHWVPAVEARDQRILRHLDGSATRGPAVIVLDYGCLGPETWQVLRRLQQRVSDRIVEWIVFGMTAPFAKPPGLSWQNVTVIPSRPLGCS